MTTTAIEPPLLAMSRQGPTVLWCDSARPQDLARAMGWGAVGATCNPVLALAALRAQAPRWRARLAGHVAAHPAATEAALGQLLVQDLIVESAALLEPVFRDRRGRDGRVSVQTDPRLARDVTALVEQSVGLAALAPNIIVKIPATAEGIAAMEEVTARGVSVNATVSFTVAQAIAVGEAVEQGLDRAAAAGIDTTTMGPVCTIMVGRLDDHLSLVAERDGLLLEPGVTGWAGVAVFKRAYEVYRQRAWRTRLLSAAFRSHLHWSEFVGADAVISPPMPWQLRLNAGTTSAATRIDEPVPDRALSALRRIPDFQRAWQPDGLSGSELASFGPTLRTMRQFLAAAGDLDAWVRDVVVPDPDS